MFRNIVDRIFGHKNSEEVTLERELKAMTAENLIKEFKITNTIEEDGMSEEIKQEEVLVQDAPEVKEEVSEETEVVQEEHEEQPNNEVEGNEPPETETVETPEEEVVEEPQAEQEEPVEEEQEEKVEEVVEEPVEKVEEIEPVELEQPTEEKVIEIPTNEVTVAVKDTISEREVQLLKEVEALKAEKADKELQLQKMEFSKEVAKDYEGVPGKLEDKTDRIFEIQNSALSEDTKTFVLQSLKSLSLQNLKDCVEIGHEQEVEIDEKAERQNKIKEAMDKHGLTENQAFLFVNGDRTLAEAIKASARVQKRK